MRLSASGSVKKRWQGERKPSAAEDTHAKLISWERPVDKGKRAQGGEEGCLAPQRMRRGNSEKARTIRSLRDPRHKTSPSCAGVPQRSNKTIHRFCSSRHWLASSARSKPASALAFPLAPSGLHFAVFLVWMSQGSKQTP